MVVGSSRLTFSTTKSGAPSVFLTIKDPPLYAVSTATAVPLLFRNPIFDTSEALTCRSHRAPFSDAYTEAPGLTGMQKY